jgi:hypothetical protein
LENAVTDAEDEHAKPEPERPEDDALQPPGIEPTKHPSRRMGFLAGQIWVPDDFDTMMQDEIERMFYGEEE